MTWSHNLIMMSSPSQTLFVGSQHQSLLVLLSHIVTTEQHTRVSHTSSSSDLTREPQVLSSWTAHSVQTFSSIQHKKWTFQHVVLTQSRASN